MKNLPKLCQGTKLFLSCSTVALIASVRQSTLVEPEHIQSNSRRTRSGTGPGRNSQCMRTLTGFASVKDCDDSLEWFSSIPIELQLVCSLALLSRGMLEEYHHSAIGSSMVVSIHTYGIDACTRVCRLTQSRVAQRRITWRRAIRALLAFDGLVIVLRPGITRRNVIA